ncbi:MAG: PAS domain-containing protein [Euryarchaeota archaeon]|nr:PAS domain-containing protein [Euryarchaeota archaeon]
MKIEELKEFIDSIGDMVIVVGRDRRIIAVNEALLKKCSLREEEIVGRECHTISRCLRIPCPAGVACPLQEVLDTGEVRRVIHTHYTKEGRKMVVEITASPLREDGEAAGVIEIIRDVTATYSLQESLKASLERFKKTVKIKELFTDILTHDLINVANIVLLQCETILDREKCPDTRDDLKRLKRNVERLVGMIENAARYARLQSIESLEFRQMDLTEVLRSVVSTLEESAREKEIEIEVRVREPRPAMVNPNIESVFYNLISNAIKFSPSGRRVEVDILDEGRHYLITVKDRGPGIPDEEKERIFERFKRVEKGAVKGTGLGLAIVKRIAELHGGKVWVEDNPGGGSIFYVRIPKEQG